MLRFGKTTYLSLLFKLILSVIRSNNGLCGSVVILFLEFRNIVSILFYNFTEFTKALHPFLVISFFLIQRIYDFTDFI